MNPRRSKIHIYVDILKLINRKNGRAKPTHILYGANLSHIRLKKYLMQLLDSGFIQRISEDGHVYYIITQKGYDFMHEFKKIEQFSEAFGINV
jgi:predicted transcriptional regulator